MIKTTDIYWLAGLLEGEGCFSSTSKYRSPRIQLKMTDRDVVDRANGVLRPTKYRQNGNTPRREARDRRGNRQPAFVICIAGYRAAGWMMTLYPLMGQRRRARIRELLTAWHVVGTAIGT